MIYYGQKLCITICYRQKLCAQVLIESYAFKLLAKGIGYGGKSTCNVSIKKLIYQSSRWLHLVAPSVRPRPSKISAALVVLLIRAILSHELVGRLLPDR
jgi:hypothetical protein